MFVNKRECTSSTCQCDRAAPTHVGTLSSIIITTAHIHFSPSLISLSLIPSTKLIYKGVTTCTFRTFENDYVT